MKIFNHDQSGFTLIELSIVLLVIGLLISGVIKGQELINTTKIKNLESEFKDIQSSIYTYQNKYRAIPGDDMQAVSHVGGDMATSPSGLQGNGVVNGAWNSTANTDESYLFWQHIRMDKLAMGSTDISDTRYLPINIVGGNIGIQGMTSDQANTPIFGGPGLANPIRGIYIICSAGIPGKFVRIMESDLDDGNTAAGSMMATPSSSYSIGSAIATPKDEINDDETYTVCKGI